MHIFGNAGADEGGVIYEIDAEMTFDIFAKAEELKVIGEDDRDKFLDELETKYGYPMASLVEIIVKEGIDEFKAQLEQKSFIILNEDEMLYCIATTRRKAVIEFTVVDQDLQDE